MRPIIPISPVTVYVTIICGILLTIFVIALVFRPHTRPSSRAVRWLLFAVLFVPFSVGLGRWIYDANRQPTPAEARAWVDWADAELKRRNEKFDAAVENAQRVNEKVHREMGAEKRR